MTLALIGAFALGGIAGMLVMAYSAASRDIERERVRADLHRRYGGGR